MAMEKIRIAPDGLLSPRRSSLVGFLRLVPIYEDIGSVKQQNLRKAHKKLRNAHTSPADGENRTIVHLLDAFTLHRPKAPV